MRALVVLDVADVESTRVVVVAILALRLLAADEGRDDHRGVSLHSSIGGRDVLLHHGGVDADGRRGVVLDDHVGL
ncbi:MAG: hypothetical protein CO029_02320 [Candidatus Magasanikbacteria bacterium CG_4_9_14_0_2_um_filter_41_10]|uniref:Uncharacterized protein n=1 Tax=Candidatus Magasanikbacteria bacterium CG_4_10_14_0_2_um_filter_41_31 TaxID=1974639 RepID=A0A2M7V2A8_9BACT|nr:MAG: hypothetical protein AUJ37_02815 [Candidatus Magasanikbacteria bacterium CG1_02_41_34]PIZ92553.1 MAG: hypothetical protein COX83_04000 [Candidatus Magasanikbacteria bacterium CG_4_10_14_0_2_um_filter_41_31]PJC53527.1 MAG: hypothetical protein CO029_02320 [Candidatus Magasanikbacteria bacterium CG_4_9_14_0_2_um_filter_41_10]